MILIDANLLLYAYDPGAAEHERSKAWLEATLSGSQLVRFAWVTVWAFLRISTNARVFEHPLTMEEAADAVDAWLSQPVASTLDPGERHRTVLRGLMREG